MKREEGPFLLFYDSNYLSEAYFLQSSGLSKLLRD